jgi:hypothetical protein
MLALSLEGFRSQDYPYPPPRPGSTHSFSALSVNGACPGPVGVLGRTRSLTRIDPSATLLSHRHSSQAAIPFRITSFADHHHLTPIESHLCKKPGRGWYPASPPDPFLFFPQRVNIQHTAMPVYPEQGQGASPLFSCVYSTLPVTPGVGVLSSARHSMKRVHAERLSGGRDIFTSQVTGHGTPATSSLRGSANSASLRYPFPFFPSQLSNLQALQRRFSTAHYPLFTTHAPPRNFYPPAPKLRHNPAAQGRIKVQLNDWAQPNPHTGRIQ